MNENIDHIKQIADLQSEHVRLLHLLAETKRQLDLRADERDALLEVLEDTTTTPCMWPNLDWDCPIKSTDGCLCHYPASCWHLYAKDATGQDVKDWPPVAVQREATP